MKKPTLPLLSALALFGGLAQAQILDFHIAKGTGNKPWNTPATVVQARVGDTVRIHNDDTISHQLHTFGRPCDHQPEPSAPGEFFDCDIATPVDPRIDTLYDHNAGQTARFYLKATR
jgi:hypothetical protein